MEEEHSESSKRSSKVKISNKNKKLLYQMLETITNLLSTHSSRPLNCFQKRMKKARKSTPERR